MRTRCPVCGLGLERGEHGYIVGAYMFNIIAAELLFAAIAAGVVAATVFLAFDLLFRPAQPEEFSIR
jgi:hypothetical protein